MKLAFFIAIYSRALGLGTPGILEIRHCRETGKLHSSDTRGYGSWALQAERLQGWALQGNLEAEQL